jgi:hypothetical protein
MVQGTQTSNASMINPEISDLRGDQYPAGRVRSSKHRLGINPKASFVPDGRLQPRPRRLTLRTGLQTPSGIGVGFSRL